MIDRRLAWQATLPAWDEPEVELGWSRLRRTRLDGASWVDHCPGWLPDSDALFAQLLTTAPWRQKERPMYDRMVAEPRLTVWWERGDMPLELERLRAALSQRYARELSTVGVNLYRDGADSVAWHGDTVRKVVDDAVVAIVSLGEPRRFLLRPHGGSTSNSWHLGAGDLLVMGGRCQHEWQHTIPKLRAAGPRMSVTFRHSGVT